MRRRASIRDALWIIAWIAVFLSPAIAAFLGAPGEIVVGMAVVLVVVNTIAMWTAR